ncbi:putative colanic acid biosynthesis acetyltransferase [Hirschia litorea]|uniref:Colanic acid biosynthesis acetyltransferase n=1 Tax=Hirschia litorea TaxID=1199156 RepID=A0ABW2IPN9_9PROT
MQSSQDFSKYKYRDTLTKSSKALRAIWLVVWIVFFRPSPRFMFNGWRVFLLKLFGAKIGSGSKISATCFVWAPWNLEVGKYSVLGDNVDCYSMDKIVIGSKVAVSQRSFLCTGSHDISSLKRPLLTKPIVIQDHVWVAAESMIMPGVTIHTGSVVGARSLVTKDLQEWMVCVGNPCMPIQKRKISEAETS